MPKPLQQPRSRLPSHLTLRLDLCQLTSRRRLAALAAHIETRTLQRYMRPPSMDVRVSVHAPLCSTMMYTSSSTKQGAERLQLIMDGIRQASSSQGTASAPAGALLPAGGGKEQHAMMVSAALAVTASASLQRVLPSRERLLQGAALEGAWAAGAGLVLHRGLKRVPLEDAMGWLTDEEVMADWGLYDDEGRLLVGR